jgi:hypothetical protein
MQRLLLLLLPDTSSRLTKQGLVKIVNVSENLVDMKTIFAFLLRFTFFLGFIFLLGFIFFCGFFRSVAFSCVRRPMAVPAHFWPNLNPMRDYMTD